MAFSTASPITRSISPTRVSCSFSIALSGECVTRKSSCASISNALAIRSKFSGLLRFWIWTHRCTAHCVGRRPDGNHRPNYQSRVPRSNIGRLPSPFAPQSSERRQMRWIIIIAALIAWSCFGEGFHSHYYLVPPPDGESGYVDSDLF
jgi:hypothetical protein